MAIHLDQPAAAPGANPRQAWRIVTLVLMLALFVQAVFAGAMLSGFDWARAAHAANAVVVVVAACTAGFAAIVTQRRVRNGLKLGLLLLGLAAVVLVQFALGRLAAKGINLMWLHVPLGVVLVGIAGQVVAGARRLGEDA